MSAPEDFGRLGDLLGDFCEAAARPQSAKTGEVSGRDSPRQDSQKIEPGEGAKDMALAVALLWEDIVGAEVASNAQPVQLKRGRLTVSTSSSVWAQSLQHMSMDLAARLNEHLGSGSVKEIAFRHAGWEEHRSLDGNQRCEDRPGGLTSAGRLSQEQEKALACVEGLDLPSEIRERITRAMRASFVRGQQNSVR